MTTTYNLKAKETQTVKAGRSTKDETVYTYESVAGGLVKFHSHPTRSFNWVILEANDAGQKQMKNLINAFVDAGMKRGEKSFDEAIQTLSF